MKHAINWGVLACILGIYSTPAFSSEALWNFIQRIEGLFDPKIEAATPFSTYRLERAIGQKLEEGGEPDGPRGAGHWIARNVRINSDLAVTDLHLYFWDAMDENPAEIVISAPKVARNAECVLERDLLPLMGKSLSQVFAISDAPGGLHEALYGTATWSAIRNLPSTRIWAAKRAIGELTVVVQPQTGCVQDVIISTNLPG